MPGAADKIGHYRLLATLGEGGLGVVYRAQHAETLAQVALKTIRAKKQDVVWRIRREIHALSRIEHPGVIRVVDSGMADGVPWYAMELLDGMTLESYLSSLWKARARRSRPLTGTREMGTSALKEWVLREGARFEPTPLNAPAGVPPSEGYRVPAIPLPGAPRPPAAAGELIGILTLMRHLCSTLAHIHGSGLVHMDLKPDNIFIRSDWTPVLFDFSLVSRGNMVGREDIDVGGVIQGTLKYMAPEQFRGEVVDARTDLYSLGCILYECVTGEAPFQGEDFVSLSRAHQGVPPIPPSQLVGGVPPALEEVILRLLAKNPRNRLGHASDVARVLGTLGARNTDWAGEFKAHDYLYRPEFVGRSRSLQRLDAALNALLRGQGGCLFVGAESGMGKTRLLMEFSRTCGLRNVRVVTSPCQPAIEGDDSETAIKSPPLQAFRPILEAIADHCLEAGRAESDRILGPRGPILARCDPSLAGLPGQELYQDPGDATTDVAQHRILHALGEALADFASARPIVILIDDMHWIDELSLAFCLLLQGGAFGHPRVLVVGAYRNDERHPFLERLLSSCRNENHLELGALDEQEVGEIIGGMLGMADPAHPLVRFINRRSGGNPFFAAEYLRTALAEKILFRTEQGGWDLADRSEGISQVLNRLLPLPRSLGDLVVRRLNGLPDGTQKLLEVAAVLGQEFSARLLEATGILDRFSLMEATDDLVARQILEESEGDKLRFVHEKLRQAAYERLDPERCRELHRRAAQAIEGSCADAQALEIQHSALAYHWSLARVPGKAVEYLQKAGESALSQGAYALGLGFFAKLLDLAAGEPRRWASVDEVVCRSRWERKLAECYLGLGKLAESKKHLESALSLLGYPFPRSTRSTMLGLAAKIVRQTLHRLCPLLFLGRSRRSRAVLEEASIACNRLLAVLSFNHQLAPMLYAALQNTNLAERVGSPGELSRAYASLCGILGVIPWHRKLAETYAQRGYAVAQQSDKAGLLQVLAADAIFRLGRCEWEEAVALIQRGRALAGEVGAVRHLEELQGAFSLAWFLRGNYDKSLEHAREEHRSALRGDEQSQCFGLLRMCQSQMTLGQLDEAKASLDAAGQLVSRGLDRGAEIWYLALLAFAHLIAGNPAEARKAADAAQELIVRGSPAVWYCIHAYSLVAIVYLQLWKDSRKLGGEDERTLEKAARRACRTLARCARVLPACAPRAARLRGNFRWQKGRCSRARRDWERSIELARRYRMPHDEALAHLEMGRHLPADSPEGRAHLLRANHLLEFICGKGLDFERTRRALSGDISAIQPNG